jgi:hypothetical protein
LETEDELANETTDTPCQDSIQISNAAHPNAAERNVALDACISSTGMDGHLVAIDMETSADAASAMEYGRSTEGIVTDSESEANEEDQAEIHMDTPQAGEPTSSHAARAPLVSSAILPGFVPLNQPFSPRVESVLTSSISCPGMIPSQSPIRARETDGFEEGETRQRLSRSQSCPRLVLNNDVTYDIPEPKEHPRIPRSRSFPGVAWLEKMRADSTIELEDCEELGKQPPGYSR